MNPRVKAVLAKDDFKLEIEFSNGEVGVYDCAPLLGYGVFQELVMSIISDRPAQTGPRWSGRMSRTSAQTRSTKTL